MLTRERLDRFVEWLARLLASVFFRKVEVEGRHVPNFDFIATARQESKPFFVWYAPMMPSWVKDRQGKSQ